MSTIMSSKYDDNDRAVSLAWKKFEELHSEESRPEWLDKCITVSSYKNENSNWIVKISLLEKAQLKPNQHWEGEGECKRLVEIDEKTGEHFIVICNGNAINSLVIFEAEVDFDKDLVLVNNDTELDTLDRSKYEFLADSAI